MPPVLVCRWTQSPLRQFGVLPATVLYNLEEKGGGGSEGISRLLDMDAREVGALCHNHRMGETVSAGRWMGPGALGRDGSRELLARTLVAASDARGCAPSRIGATVLGAGLASLALGDEALWSLCSPPRRERSPVVRGVYLFACLSRSFSIGE